MRSSVLSTARTSTRLAIAPIAGGLLIAVITANVLAGMPLRWALAMFGAAALVLPLLTIKNTKLYGLSLYLFLVMVEIDKGKNLTKNVVDAAQLIDTLGLVPLNAVHIIIRPSDVVLLFLLLAWVAGILSRKETFHFSRLNYVALAYLVWAAASSVVKARYRYLSLAEFLPEARAFLVFVYVTNAINTKELVRDLRKVLLVLLFVEGVVTLAGLKWEAARDLLSFLSDPSTGRIDELPILYEKGLTGGRAVGTFGNYAVTAMYLHFLLPLVLGRFFAFLGRFAGWAYLSLFSLGGVALWVTYSRAGLLGAAAGIAVCAYLCRRRGFIGSWTVFLLIYAGLAALLAMSPWIQMYLTSRPSTVSDRIPIMEKALKLIAENPIMGVGLANSTAVRRETFVDTVADEGSQPIHNHYLVVATETGVVGFALFFGFFLLVARIAFVQTRSTNPEIALFSITILSTYAAFSVQLLADTLFSHATYGMLWFWAGLAVAFQRIDPVPRQMRHTRSSPPTPQSGRAPTPTPRHPANPARARRSPVATKQAQ